MCSSYTFFGYKSIISPVRTGQQVADVALKLKFNIKKNIFIANYKKSDYKVYWFTRTLTISNNYLAFMINY